MKKLISAILALVLCLSVASAMADTLGLGSVTTLAAKPATADGDGSVEVVTTICALVLDDEGKIASIRFDVMQVPTVAVTAAGEVTDVSEADLRTKIEKGSDYGMSVASSVGDYYEHMAGLEAWCVGKTVEEAVAGIEGDDADMKAGCTVNLSAQLAALQKAAEAAK